MLSVTKDFVFEKGGLTITPLSGNVDFKVFVKTDAGGDWTEKEAGKVLVKDATDKIICYLDAKQIKVSVVMPCDGCASVCLHDCK